MRCVNGAWRVFCTFFVAQEWILDTGKKTVTVPWNYAAKLEEINRILKDGGGAKQYPFKTCLGESWKPCMDDTDKHLKVADKPSHKGIIKMQRLYRQLGTFVAVAREAGRSASSVSKYVPMKGVPANIPIAVENLLQKVEG